jgi:hypothetical protein
MSATAELNHATATAQASFRSTDAILRKNLGGITEELAARRPRADMNNIIWLVGHVAYWRYEAANALGVPVAQNLADISRFRGVVWREPNDTTGWSLESVVALADNAFARLTAALADGVMEKGDAEASAKFTTFFIHEAYTVGQVAVMRRLLGLKGAVGEVS